MTCNQGLRGSRYGTGDRDIRAALLQQLEGRREGHPHRLIQEFWIPISHERADVVEVNGLLAGFEIKSARDTLARLPRQSAAFSAVFDQVSLVCATNHLARAEGVVPSWWGLVRVDAGDNAVTLWPVRQPRLNPLPDHETRLRLLWKAELVVALQARGISTAGLVRDEMRRTLMEHAGIGELNPIVCHALLHRSPAARRW
jgi:hypothetical protein